MGHIQKMAMAIYDCQERSADNETVAQAAFNALMDAVPDLVWEKDTAPRQHPNSFLASGLRGDYRIKSVGGGVVQVWFPRCILSDISGVDMDEAKAAANAHHRKLVSKIWGRERDG